MFKPVPVAIGLRYLRAKRRNGFISFISLASILGIALGVTALITTLSVMSGFQREIRDRMLQMAAHATVSGGEPLQIGRRVHRVEGPRVVAHRRDITLIWRQPASNAARRDTCGRGEGLCAVGEDGAGS
jgi:ABC-type lipoprotein release transport system permease subunit